MYVLPKLRTPFNNAGEKKAVLRQKAPRAKHGDQARHIKQDPREYQPVQASIDFLEPSSARGNAFREQ